jgi:hypothetical protein
MADKVNWRHLKEKKSMSIFAVLSRKPNSNLDGIQEKFAQEHYKLSDNQWFICSGGTSKELSEKLGIFDKEEGPGPVAGYFTCSKE